MLVWELVLSGREQLVPNILTNKRKTSLLVLVLSSKGVKPRYNLDDQEPIHPFFFRWGEMKLLTLSTPFSSDVPIF